MQSGNKNVLAAIVIAGALLLGVTGWWYTQQGASLRGSAEMFTDRWFDTSRSETMTEEERMNPELSSSTELDAIEQDLNGTVILDEDFSDL